MLRAGFLAKRLRESWADLILLIMLTYEFTKKARRRWRKFPPDIKERIVVKVKEYCLREDIFRAARHLGGKFYRFRVGDYRVIFKWEGGEHFDY